MTDLLLEDSTKSEILTESKSDIEIFEPSKNTYTYVEVKVTDNSKKLSDKLPEYNESLISMDPEIVLNPQLLKRILKEAFMDMLQEERSFFHDLLFEAFQDLAVQEKGRNVFRDYTMAPLVEGLRPYGLCKGEFIVPDDFDDPLPEEILRAFEGADENPT